MKEFGMVLLFLAFCVGMFSKEIYVEIHERLDKQEISIKK